MIKVVRKLRSIAFSATMKAHAMSGLPAMTRREREAYLAALLAVSRNDRLELFEWGSGYSTVWTARRLKEREVSFHIHTLDNHAGWHQKVHEMVEKQGLSEYVTLHLCEFPPFWQKLAWNPSRPPVCGELAPSLEAETHYIELPRTLGVRFNAMLVDARFRSRCLGIAAECVAPTGIVVLHDAQKSWYHGPTALFAHSHFIDSGEYYPGDPGEWKMWFGSHENGVVESL